VLLGQFPPQVLAVARAKPQAKIRKILDTEDNMNILIISLNSINSCIYTNGNAG
jgi:hypothetical protein